MLKKRVYGLKNYTWGAEKYEAHAFATLLLNSNTASDILVYILMLSHNLYVVLHKLLTATWLFVSTAFTMLFVISFIWFLSCSPYWPVKGIFELRSLASAIYICAFDSLYVIKLKVGYRLRILRLSFCCFIHYSGNSWFGASYKLLVSLFAFNDYFL